MAKSLPLFVGLDIGTGFIKIAVGQKKSANGFEIIHLGRVPSRGVRRGVIFDVEAVAKCVREAVEGAELAVGHDLNGVYISVNGSHIFCAQSRGLVSVSRADGKISVEDVERVLQAAKTIPLSSGNKEIIDVYPREFIVDGEDGVKDAIGMKGVRLEAEVLIVAGFTPYLKNFDQAILRAGSEVLNRAPVAIASSLAVLSEQQKELGAAVLDIGAGTTNLAVYEEGDLLHMTVLPIGSANVTNDIAIGAKTDVAVAERLKIEKGICFFAGADKKIKLSGEDADKDKIFSQRLISKIIQERVNEIFGLANKELKKIGREKKLPAGIVLCGGGAKLGKIEDAAKKIFQLTVSTGSLQSVENVEDDPSMAAACGLAAIGFRDQEEESSGGLRLPEGGWEKVKKIFKIFVP